MRISNKKLGLSRQLENENFHHNWSVSIGPVKVSDKGVKVEDPVKWAGDVIHDTGKAIGKGAEDAWNTTVKAAKDTGNAALEVAQVGYDYSIGLGVQGVSILDRELLNGNVDIFTGGLLTDAQNMGNIFGETAKGEAIDDNIRSGIRVGAVTGAVIASGGTAGVASASTATGAALTTSALTVGAKDSWEGLAGGLARAGGAASGIPMLKNIGDTVAQIINPPKMFGNPQEFLNDTNEYSTNIIESDNTEILVAISIVGVILITAALIAKKKRKK